MLVGKDVGVAQMVNQVLTLNELLKVNLAGLERPVNSTLAEMASTDLHLSHLFDE